MNALDIAILVVGAVVAFAGWRIGIIRVVITVVGIVGGVWLAGRLYPTVATLLQTWIEGENLARVVAFVVVFAATLIAASVAAAVIKRILNLLLLGWVDRAAGMALGLVVGLGALAAFLAVLGAFPVGGMDTVIRESLLGQFLVEKYRLLMGLLPRDVGRFG